MNKRTSIFTVVLVILIVAGLFGFTSILLNNSDDIDYVDNNSKVELSLDEMYYTACGDSITANGNPGYCQRVSSTLKMRGYYNNGISGTTMSYCTAFGTPMVERTSSVNQNSNVITIMFGTNDCSFGCGLGNINSTSKNDFYGAYKMVISGLQARCPNAKILLMTPLQNADYNASNEGTKVNSQGKHLIQYVNAVLELGRTYNLPVLDLYHNSGITSSTLSALTSDGVHPTQSCYDNVLSPKIAQFIKDNCN